jgi:hypothetical protein
VSLFVGPKPGGKESMKLVNAGGCGVGRSKRETPTPSPGLALASPTNSIKTQIGMMRILFTVVDLSLDNEYRKIIQNPFRQNRRRCNIPQPYRFGRINFARLSLLLPVAEAVGMFRFYEAWLSTLDSAG